MKRLNKRYLIFNFKIKFFKKKKFNFKKIPDISTMKKLIHTWFTPIDTFNQC